MELLHKYHCQPKQRHEKVDPFHHTWPGLASLIWSQPQNPSSSLQNRAAQGLLEPPRDPGTEPPPSQGPPMVGHSVTPTHSISAPKRLCEKENRNPAVLQQEFGARELLEREREDSRNCYDILPTSFRALFCFKPTRFTVV